MLFDQHEKKKKNDITNLEPAIIRNGLEYAISGAEILTSAIFINGKWKDFIFRISMLSSIHLITNKYVCGMCIPDKHHMTDGPIEIAIKITYCASQQAPEVRNKKS